MRNHFINDQRNESDFQSMHSFIPRIYKFLYFSPQIEVSQQINYTLK